jgi:hypothetical protein
VSAQNTRLGRDKEVEEVEEKDVDGIVCAKSSKMKYHDPKMQRLLPYRVSVMPKEGRKKRKLMRWS